MRWLLHKRTIRSNVQETICQNETQDPDDRGHLGRVLRGQDVHLQEADRRGDGDRLRGAAHGGLRPLPERSTRAINLSSRSIIVLKLTKNRIDKLYVAQKAN